MGRSFSAQARCIWIVVLLCCACRLPGGGAANAQTLFDITFSQFATGTVYTSASGPPADFSLYYPSGLNSNGVICQILSAFTINLTNQPLVCNNPGLGVGNFLMQMGNVSSNVVTLTMQLALDNAVGAQVVFGQSASGSNVTSITLSFPETATDTMQVSSVDGLSDSPTVLYSSSAGLDRSTVQNISFSLNLLLSTFSLSVNGVALASNAPIGTSQPLNQATISIGDTEAQVVGGTGGIDNIVLTAVPVPTVSSISVNGTEVLIGLSTSTNAHYDVQTTTNLLSGAWITIITNVPGVGTLTNFDCGPATGPQQSYRVAAHP